jgi:hypothetical protein
MIFETLSFLAAEINKYLNLKLASISDPRLKLGNVSRALDTTLTGAASLEDKAILSLVNIEEDRVAKQHENEFKNGLKTIYKNPPLLLNLYILLAINKDNYQDSLILLGHIVQFFQYQSRFTPLTHPSLDSRIEKLTVELYTLNFEQVNHLWSTLGGKYLPSALYKVRQLTINEDVEVSESGLIREIDLNAKGKQAVS